MTDIFLKNAPIYWEHGMPVIPLYRNEKKPIPHAWSQWHDHMPDAQTQVEWLNAYPDGNLGLVLGAQSGIVAFDIDTENPLWLDVILRVLPATFWKRVGKKGMVLAYRWTGLKTFRIKTVSGESICEMLSDKTQVVLPPSIHPDTRKPYTANCNLWEVRSGLPALPDDIEEVLRNALKEAGAELSHSGWSRVTDFVAAGARDTNLTEKAGLFAYSVLRGERTLKEALGMLASYNEEFIQSVAGDPMDIKKHQENLIRFLQRDVFEKKKILPLGWDTGLTREEKAAWGLEFDKDLEEWPFAEVIGFLKAAFEAESGEGGHESMKAVEEILRRLALTKNLSRLEIDRVLDYIAKHSGLGLKVGALQRQVKAIQTEDGIAGLNHTEIAQAMMDDLNAMYSEGGVRFHAEQFWKWGGSHWEEIDQRWLILKISDGYGGLAGAKRYSDINQIINLLKALLPQGLVDGEGMKTRGVNFVNGFLTEDLRLLPHSPSLGMTYTLPFRFLAEKVQEGFDLSVCAPMFWRFVQHCWLGDPDFSEKVRLLQEMLSVILFGLGSRYQRAFLLHGVPKSGKSQLMKIAAALVPDGARSAVAPESWGDKFMPAEMAGKILNLAGELSERKKIDGQRFKDIVDGSEISVQKKFGQPFSVQIHCSHLFASNHLPKSEDTSGGFTRRWAILSFERPVDDVERVADIGDIIAAQEREYIVAWAITAMVRLKETGEYTLPASHHMLVSEVSRLNNPVLAFLTDNKEIVLTRNMDDKMTEEGLYMAYYQYSMAILQSRPIAVAEFRGKLREILPGLGMKSEHIDAPGHLPQLIYRGVKKR